MNFIGKILVVINMAMSFIFMGFAVMVYTSRVDLRGQLQQAQKQVSDLNGEKSRLETNNQQASKELADEKSKLEKIVKDNDQQKAALEGQVAQLREEITRSKTSEAEAVTQMNAATTEQGQRRAEVEQLRNIRNELLKSNSEIVTQKTAMQDQLSQVSNDLQLATSRNQQLVDRVKQLEQFVVRVNNGVLPTDIELATGDAVPPPPEVKGLVREVDDAGRFIQISLGEDDGIRKGQMLHVWRNTPEPKYLGQVKIFTTNANTSVAQPVSVQGQIQKNDEVGARIISAN